MNLFDSKGQILSMIHQLCDLRIMELYHAIIKIQIQNHANPGSSCRKFLTSSDKALPAQNFCLSYRGITLPLINFREIGP